MADLVDVKLINGTGMLQTCALFLRKSTSGLAISGIGSADGRRVSPYVPEGPMIKLCP